MYGSKKVIVERFEESSFIKFAKQYLIENGYSNVYPIIKKYNSGTFYSANKGRHKTIISIEYTKVVFEKADIKTKLNIGGLDEEKINAIIVNREYSDSAKNFCKNNNIQLIGIIEIDYWLNSKFNTCLEFLNYMDLTKIRREGYRYSPTDLISKFNDLKITLSRTPNERDIIKYTDVSSGIYVSRWGTWRNFLASMNENIPLRYSKPNKSMTASVADLIESYLIVRAKLQRIPTLVEINNLGKYTQEYYSFYYGTFSNFIMIVENEVEKAIAISKDELIDEYRALQKTISKPPTIRDINNKSKYSPIAYFYHWGNWNNFLKEMNEILQHVNINDKELVKAYFNLKEIIEKDPAQDDFVKNCNISHLAFELRFGSWNNFVDLLKYPEFVSPEPNDIDLVTDYYRVKKILKKDKITKTELARHSLYKISDYNNYYQSLEKFWDAIDIIEEKSKMVSESDLINDYLRLINELQKTWLTIYDVKYNSIYQFGIYLSKFKSWPNVMIYMKDFVGKNKYFYDITNNQLIEEYFRLEKVLNKSPLFVSDIRKHSKYCDRTYETRFGSWKTFLTTIGQKSVREISEEEIIEDYYRVKKMLNKKVVYRRDYDKYGKYSDNIMRLRWGKWSEFLKAIGEDTSHIKEINREILIEDYKRVKDLLGLDKLSQTEIQEFGKFTRSTYSKYFGGWDQFLEFMGEDTSKFQYTEEELIDEYFRVKKLLNKNTISVAEMDQYAKMSGSLYRLRFGSWIDFLKKIGESTDHLKPITDDDLKNEYIRVKNLLKKSKLTIDDIKKYGKYKHKAYKNHFGSWDAFVRLMGDGSSKLLNTDKEVVDEYWRVKKELKKEIITQSDMDKYGKLSSSLYVWRYGSWINFLEKIGENAESFKPATEQELIDEYKRLKEVYNKPVLKAQDLSTTGKYSVRGYLKHFGSWDAFIKLVGDGNARYKATDKELIEEYWRLKKQLNKNIVRASDMDKFGNYRSDMYWRRFRSWEEFLKTIGEDPELLKTISDDDLINEYKRLQKTLYKTLVTSNEIVKFAKYSYLTFTNRFGGWDNFLKKMGIENTNRVSTNQELIDEYWHLKKESVKGYVSAKDMDELGNYCAATYAKRFGSWRKFLEMIGEDPFMHKKVRREKSSKKE